MGATGRIGSIDFLKGFCLFCVFLGHALIDLGFATHLYQSFYMPAFFLLSGYCYKKTTSFREAIVRDGRRILAVYYIWTFGVLFAIMMYKLFITHSGTEDLLILMKKTLLGIDQHQFVAPLWFLITLFSMRIIWVILDFVINNRTIQHAIVFALAIIGCILNALGYTETPFRAVTALICLPFFSVGILTKDYRNATSRHSLTPFLLILTTLLWIACSLINVHGRGAVSVWAEKYNIYPLFFFSAILGTLVHLNFAGLLEKIRIQPFKALYSLFRYLGENSLGVLVTINLSVTAARKMLELSAINIPTAPLHICTCGLAIALSVLATKVFNLKYFNWLVGK